MRTFDQGDVVRVPFPYTDRNMRQHRPALVVSDGGLGERGGLLWVVMVTSAANRPWPGDVSLEKSHRDVGLPVPSIIRSTKVATIDSRHARWLGTLPETIWAEVATELKRHLGFR